MKKGLTRDELIEELGFQKEAKRDYVIGTERLSVVEDFFEGGGYYLAFKDMMGREQAFSITEHMLGQIAAHTKVSLSLVSLMRNGTPKERNELGQLLTVRLQENPSKRLVRTLGQRSGDPLARAFLSSRYRVIDNYDLFGTLDEGYAEMYASGYVTPERLYLKYIMPHVNAEIGKTKNRKGVEVGDIIECGASIVNSEVGLGKLHSDVFIHRLACKNGAIRREHGDTIHQIHKGSEIEDNWDEYIADEAQVEANMNLYTAIKVGMDSMSRSGKWFESVAMQFLIAQDDKVLIDPMIVLSRLGSLTKEEAEKVSKKLLKDGDLTRFGMINAITSTARDTHNTMSYERATELEVLGGQVLDITPDMWDLLTVPPPTEKVAKATKRTSKKTKAAPVVAEVPVPKGENKNGEGVVAKA